MELEDVQKAYAGIPAHPFYDGRPAIEPSRRFMIGMTPRSGSTLLAQELSRRYGIGHVGEFLNEGYIATFEHLFPTPSLSDFEQFVLSSFTTADGIFGLKTDWFRFCRAQYIGYLPRLFESPAVHVLLLRRDFVSQAISLAISMQTGIWHESNLRFTDEPEAYARLIYDPAVIRENIIGLMEQEFGWANHMKAVGGDVIEIFYEDMVASLDDTVHRIATAIRPSAMPTLSRSFRPVMNRVPSGVNSQWKLRFLGAEREFVDYWTIHRGHVSSVA